jgi:hypothetical protein
MEPYNIKISYGTKEVTLTILPTAEGYYKVIYFGGILGGVCYDGKDWDLMEQHKITAGDLPFYEPGPVGERIEIELNDHVVDRIGWEINLYENDDLEAV